MNKNICTLINDNITALTELKSVIFKLDAFIYYKIATPVFSASIGNHCRHIIEHYLLFLNHHKEGTLNYDLRPRDTLLETSMFNGMNAIDDVINRLTALPEPTNTAIRIHHATSTAQEESFGVQSSYERELMFLHCHLVHHFAIIVLIHHHHNIPIEPTLGIAPSTLKYHSQKIPD